MTDLPIDDVLTELRTELARHGAAVLEAPPGAGKTTRVPLALLPDVDGRIVMLEPRRIAARAAADRMAATLGEAVGETVGYRIRGEFRSGPSTRIEVVTEGVLTRMIQADPELSGVGCVIFDEFHERSLQADLGLALTLDLRGELRGDLRLLVMSATLDAGSVAELVGAPAVRSEGRAHPVETRHLPRPAPPRARMEREMAELILTALGETGGGALAFLPGEGEIRRTLSALEGRLPADVRPRALYGAMPLADQRAAIAPETDGRKLVLATAIAETSLTIEDVTVVIDGGKSRRARFDPGSGMTRLVTEPVSRAEAEQRRGRAGRIRPGVCYRLWTEAQTGALPAHPPAEIEAADLAGLALDLAEWGAAPGDLRFPTPPPEAALSEARALLEDLGAMAGGAITPHGREIARMPLHPRLAHMLGRGGPDAALMAALLSDRDPLRGAGADLRSRLAALRGERRGGDDARGALRRIADEAKRLKKFAGPGRHSAASLAALAYPDRIGLRRPGDAPRWHLSGGKGVRMDEGDGLAGARMIVAVETDGHPREGLVRQAVEIGEAEVRALFADRIVQEDVCEWSPRSARVETRRRERLGALVLSERHWPGAPSEEIARALLGALRVRGALALNFSPEAERLRTRAALVPDSPSLSDDALIAEAEDWLLPFLPGLRTLGDLRSLDLLEPLRQRLGREAIRKLDRLFPPSFATPLGRAVPIDYSGESPEIAVPLQEMFGVADHPSVGPGRTPLRITLLSPARTPLQTTSDLPGFWASSYAEVRKDMRGRYPRHPWPEDPTKADPTAGTRKRPR